MNPDYQNKPGKLNTLILLKLRKKIFFKSSFGNTFIIALKF